VYYDFDWSNVFQHDRSMFPRGRRLAQFVQSRCPHGKVPALLLTCLPDAREGGLETETHFVAVVRIHEYLTSADGDPATTYFAAHFAKALLPQPGHRIVQVAADRAEELDLFLDQNLGLDTLQRWLRRNPTRRELLLELLREASISLEDIFEPAAAVHFIQNLGMIDASLGAALCDLLERHADNPTRLALILGLTASSEGRATAAEAMARRLEDRVADARAAAAAFQALLTHPGASETDLQKFIEDHPWLVALTTCVSVLGRKCHGGPRISYWKGTTDTLIYWN
jgi:hypothetical protein